MGGHELRYLLDTTVWLRARAQPSSIPEAFQGTLALPNEIFGLSAISLWEIGKKNQIGKLPLDRELLIWLREALGHHISLLPITPEIVAEAMSLRDFPVRDPAHELIVATAKIHSLVLLTTDSHLKDYPHAKISYFKPV